MKFTMTRRRLAAFALASIIFGVAAPASSFAQEKDKVVLGALRFTSHAAGFIAYEKGYFDKENLDVSFRFFQAAQPIAVATAGGDVDFGVAGVTGGLMNLAQKNAIRIVAGVLHEKKGVDGMMVMASNKAYENGLDAVPKIKGHSMAMTQVGSTFHYMTSRIADKEGFDISDVKLVPLQKVGAMVAALKSGQVDAMIMVPHIAKPLVESGNAKKLGWLNDFAQYQISTLFTSVDNIKNRRDVVERFIRAYAKGIADFDRVMLSNDADPAEKEAMTKMIAKYVSPNKPYEKAKAAIQEGSMYLNENAELDKTDVAKQAKWFKDQHLVNFNLKIDQLVDDSFVKNY